MSGVIAAAVVAHVPTLSRREITPEFQRTLVDGEVELGRDLRSLEPDLWVVASTHWVSTFNWFATSQTQHEGRCVADEAPDLIPGMPYSYRGDPDFALALVDEWKRLEIPALRNQSPHYEWDYGTFVPLSHLDPDAEVAVVGVPVVLMADHVECARAGAAIHATARRLGRRTVFLASTALSHALVRGRHFMPTPERIDADQRLLGQLKRGAIDEVIAGFGEYSRLAVAEMGGRALAMLLGVTRALTDEGARLEGRQYGDYAQSSGSGNANLLIASRETLTRIH
jgi:aromatic ring-opening dioxygenase catalytic subunit (LigB family)